MFILTWRSLEERCGCVSLKMSWSMARHKSDMLGSVAFSASLVSGWAARIIALRPSQNFFSRKKADKGKPWRKSGTAVNMVSVR